MPINSNDLIYSGCPRLTNEGLSIGGENGEGKYTMFYIKRGTTAATLTRIARVLEKEDGEADPPV